MTSTLIQLLSKKRLKSKSLKLNFLALLLGFFSYQLAQAQNTVNPASSSPNVCINTAITNITHTTTGATGILDPGVSGANGLPAGVSATWASNTITISGTPTASGVFSYSIPLTGGNGSVNATGTITVAALPTTANAGTDQNFCNNTATAASLTLAGNAPTDGTGAWTLVSGTATITTPTSNTSQITGVPTTSQARLRWTISNGVCPASTDEVILENIHNYVNVSSAAGTDNQNVCISTVLGTIQYQFNSFSGITGTNVTGLPNGVNRTHSIPSYACNIAGTPTQSGTFPYTITSTGGKCNISANGTITVTANQAVTAASSSPSLTINTALTPITHTTTGATGISNSDVSGANDLPAGVSATWASNTITISGTPSASGAYSYRIPLIGNCGNAINATGTIYVCPTTNGTVAGSNSVCPSASSTFTLSGHIGTVIRWERSTDNVSWSFVTNTTTSHTRGTSGGNAAFVYFRAVTNPYNGSSCVVNSTSIFNEVANNWTGNTSNSWNNINNWSCGVVPNGSNYDATTISSGSPILDINLSLQSGKSLLLSGTGTLTIEAGKTLTIASGGTVDFGGKLVTLKSDASGTAAIGTIAGTLSNATNVTVERYIPGARKFRLMAHPFTSAQNLSVLTDDIDITGNTTGVTDNNTSKTVGTGFTAVLLNNPSAFRFSTADANGATSDAGWKAFTAADGSGANNTWGVGQGIRVLIRGTKGQGLINNVAYTPSSLTLDMTGTVNIGNVDLTLVTGGTGTTAGFNLVGNPYPSPVNISAVVFASTGVADINKTVYTRNPQSGSYTTQLLANGTSYSIPSYAAVFIRNIGSGSVILPFTEARKASTSSLTTFKNGLTNIALFEFKIGGVVYDNLNIGFDENASSLFENKLDAIKLSNDSFNFSAITSNGEYVCTDFRPFINEGKIKLFTNIKSGSTEIEINATAVDLPADKDLFFVDQYTNKTVKVDSKFKYTFTIDANNQNTFGSERFYLTTSMGTSVNEMAKESFCSIYPNPITDILNIALSSSKEGNYTYTVLNQLGQTILSGDLMLANGKPASIKTQDISNGVYFLKITNGNQSQTIQFIK